MTGFGLLIFLLFLCVPINCWLGQMPYNPKEFRKHNVTDAHCFAPLLGRFKKGQEKPLKHTCGIATCRKNRGISLMGCGSVGTTRPCRVVAGDLSKPYPACCNKVVCPKPGKKI